MKKTLLFFPLLLLFFLAVNLVTSPYINAGETFPSYFSNGSGLGFQQDDVFVLLTVTSGNLNSSVSQLVLSDNGGYYRFIANESVTLLITFNVTRVKVQGDSGNDIRIIISGSSFSINLNDSILIEWYTSVTAWLPLLFILGVLGLLTTFTGALYGVSEIKKRNYYEGLRMAIILITIGMAFVLAWLWG